jgi:hypothetical protein
MTFRNPESESDFHFPSPELVNHCTKDIKGGPKPSSLPFFRGDFKSNFRLSGNFVPVGHFFPASSSNRAAEVGVGVKWSGPRRLGKMAARSDAARQRPPGHPGLQHTSFRPPSDATPPRYCRFSHFTTYRGPRGAGIGWQSTQTAIAGRGCVRGWSNRSMLKPWVSWWSLPRGIAPGRHLPQTAHL